MRYVTEFRDGAVAARLVERIQALSPVKANLMEVCGTHTMAIARTGIKGLLPEGVSLVSGPGCPVCVTPTRTVDEAIELARTDGVILTTFGDMIRVPGTSSSLQHEKAAGRDIRVVYSTLDALRIAEENPDKTIVFLAVGFETTSPSIACSLQLAEKKELDNFLILPAHKVVPPAMEALVSCEELSLDGFICPGHVSTIIGSRPYEFLARDHGIPCVITGFEPLDVLQGIYMLLKQVSDGRAEVEIQYTRSVRPEGNELAQKRLYEVFEVGDSTWRGIGTIPGSGLDLREEFKGYDATKRFDLHIPESKDPPGCRCGDVLRGIMSPSECGLFGKTCTPEHPVGPCMVSSEGSCAAAIEYGV